MINGLKFIVFREKSKCKTNATHIWEVRCSVFRDKQEIQEVRSLVSMDEL